MDTGIQLIMTSGTLSIKINNIQGAYFKTGKELDKGIPYPPFYIILLTSHKAKSWSKGESLNILIMGCLFCNMLMTPFFAFKMTKKKLLIWSCSYTCNEAVSGLNINFSNSDVILVSQDMNKMVDFSNMFNCAISKWAIKYLGVPVSGTRLQIVDCLPIEEKKVKRLDGRQGISLVFFFGWGWFLLAPA